MTSSLRNRPSGRHSELHAWMVENFHDLSGEPLNWRWMMREIAERGLTNRMGKPPPLATAKRTWFRVVAVMKARPAVVAAPVRAAPVPVPSQSPAFGFATIKPKKE